MCLLAVKLDHSGKLFLLIEWMGNCILSLTHGSEQRGSNVICILWKTDLEIFFKFTQGSCPWMAFAWKFSWIFLIFWGGSVGQIIYREYIVFQGSNISCSPACTLDCFIQLLFTGNMNSLLKIDIWQHSKENKRPSQLLALQNEL